MTMTDETEEQRLFPLPPPVERSLDPDLMSAQLRAVWEAVRDGEWRTLAAISGTAFCSEPSASARLRDLRRLGATVERKRGEDGTNIYRCRP